MSTDMPAAPVPADHAAAGRPSETVAAPSSTPGKKRQTFDRSIVDGPVAAAVWKIAWPSVLQNAIGGLQGIVDHAMVGHFVGYTGNAAIGVSWQIFLVVIVFISSVFTGMGVLVSRVAGANEPDKVNRTVYQACLTAVALSVGVLAPVGYLLSPTLLDLVHATPAVRAEALPFLQTMFVYSVGLLMFFMLGGALRAAQRCADSIAARDRDDDPELRAERRADPRRRAHSGFWHPWRGDGHRHRQHLCFRGRLVVDLCRAAGGALRTRHVARARFHDHSRAVSIRSAGRHSGRRHERGGRHAPSVHRVAPRERGSAGGIRGWILGTVFVDYLDFGGPDGGRRRSGGTRIWAPGVLSAARAGFTSPRALALALRA